MSNLITDIYSHSMWKINLEWRNSMKSNIDGVDSKMIRGQTRESQNSRTHTCSELLNIYLIFLQPAHWLWMDHDCLIHKELRKAKHFFSQRVNLKRIFAWRYKTRVAVLQQYQTCVGKYGVTAKYKHSNVKVHSWGDWHQSEQAATKLNGSFETKKKLKLGATSTLRERGRGYTNTRSYE